MARPMLTSSAALAGCSSVAAGQPQPTTSELGARPRTTGTLSFRALQHAMKERIQLLTQWPYALEKRAAAAEPRATRVDWRPGKCYSAAAAESRERRRAASRAAGDSTPASATSHITDATRPAVAAESLSGSVRRATAHLGAAESGRSLSKDSDEGSAQPPWRARAGRGTAAAAAAAASTADDRVVAKEVRRTVSASGSAIRAGDCLRGSHVELVYRYAVPPGEPQSAPEAAAVAAATT